MARFQIQLEGEASVSVSSIEAVVASLARLHPKGPSFVVLSRDDGSYVQTAGARLRLTVEFRKVYESGFTHFTVGRKPFDKTPVYINCRCGPITCHLSESMTLTDAEAIFTEFFIGGRVPSSYNLRNQKA